LAYRHIHTEFLASGNTYPSLMRFLGSNTLITPFWLKVAAITTSVLTWIGVACLQQLVDKPLGVAIHNDPTAKAMRFLNPLSFIGMLFCSIAYNIGRALAINDNAGISVFDSMDISSYLGWTIITVWGVIWASSSRDTWSRGLSVLLTVSMFPIMSSTLNEMDLIIFFPSFIGMIGFGIVGTRQFFAFRKVRNEINALSDPV